MDPLSSRYGFLKITIKETYGASKTYLNQFFLFEEYIPITESMSESQNDNKVEEQKQPQYDQLAEKLKKMD
jgi:hypothetical protein